MDTMVVPKCAVCVSVLASHLTEKNVAESKALLHVDERLGHVAVDMGLMNREQVVATNLRVMSAGAMRTPANFGRVAVELGYLTGETLEALETEERRRRRLITGYEIIDIIGTGTIATVYHAVQLAMEREVALKILHPRLASDPVFVHAYIAEAQAVSRFHHPNIVQGFDAGESNGFYYFAHEYLSGGSMADRLRRHREEPFTENQLLRYLRQTNAALGHAWAVAVYHGDINPGNLLLDGMGNIKLANLGVPRVAGMAGSGTAGNVMPGFVRCGPDYAAPEQLYKPELVNSRTDIYSLGATFYHISFGVPPFAAASGETLEKFRERNPVPAFSLKIQENFSGKYLRLLHDMLEVDPANRISDPEDLAARLELFHNADSDYTGLARQVRQAPGPSSSARMSARVGNAARAPSAFGGERSFSLRSRLGGSDSSRAVKWLVAALVLLILLVVAGILILS